MIGFFGDDDQTRHKSLIENLISQHFPAIVGSNIAIGGLAKAIDKEMYGKSRFFKRLDGEDIILALDLSGFSTISNTIGDSGIMLEGFSYPLVVGDILEFKGDQYRLDSITDGILYVNPPLLENVDVGEQFRLVAFEIDCQYQISDYSVKLYSRFQLDYLDDVQIENNVYQILEALENSPNNWTVTFIQKIDNTVSNVKAIVKAKPLYISNPLTLERVSGPFEIAFPIATQFDSKFETTISLDLMHDAFNVAKTVRQSSSSTSTIRSKILAMAISANNLVMWDRATGKIDFDGSRVGLAHNSAIQWEEDFPKQVNIWTIPIKAEVSGKIIISMYPKFSENPVQQVRVIPAGSSVITIDGFEKYPDLDMRKIVIAFLADNVDAQDAYVWLSSMIPDTVYPFIRYRLSFNSEELWKHYHILIGNPRILPFLLDISLCYGSQSLDAGYLLKR